MKLERPLLAAKTTDADLQRLQYPVLASPKIDGVRALCCDGNLLSRTMKMIPNEHIQRELGDVILHGLDGELVVGEPTDKNLMQQTVSGVMSRGGKPSYKYYVFDTWDSRKAFRDRLRAVESHVAEVGDPTIVFLPHILINSYEDLLDYEDARVLEGYEGIMIRSLLGHYKQNRSTVREGILLKVKRFNDSEAQVLSYDPLLRNQNAAQLDERGYTKRSSHKDNLEEEDLLGALHVQDVHSGVIFSIGSGFTLAQRQQLWEQKSSLVGRIIKYKHFSVGVKDKPRFPIFLGFRHPLDMVR